MNFSFDRSKYQKQKNYKNGSGHIGRVLIVTWNFPPKKGGMENLNYDIFKHLSKTNDVFVIAPYARNIRHNPYIFRAPVRGIFPFFFYAVLKGTSLCIKFNIDIILYGSLIVTPVGFLLNFFSPCTIAYAHGLDIIYENRVYQFFVRSAVRRLKGIICNSRNTESLLLEKFEYRGITRVIHPGISIDMYGGKSGRYFKTVRPQKRFVLSIGRLTERKGLVEFIENCFTRLAAEFNDIDFIIAGDDPVEAVFHGVGYRERLMRTIKRLGLTNRVRLLGWTDEAIKKQLLATCECFVFPVLPARSDVEGFGIVAIETAASGRPTIAFDTGGVGDAVIEGRTGTLLTPGDYDGMFNAIRSVLENPFQYECGINEIRNRYDWDLLVSKYHDFFNECSSGN